MAINPMTGRFDNSNVAWPANFHGGDLTGTRKKIEDGYFEKLGVNTIWVAPLNKIPRQPTRSSPNRIGWYTGYHGYWPVSSDELDPPHRLRSGFARAGRFRACAWHERDCRSRLHHVHAEHHGGRSIAIGSARSTFRMAARICGFGNEQQFTTWFEPYLPSFDFSKNEPVHALIENSIWWLKTVQAGRVPPRCGEKHILPRFLVEVPGPLCARTWIGIARLRFIW